MSDVETRVSVLITAWDHQDLLDTCLNAVRRCHPKIEIVVVDNGSSPPLTLPPDIICVRSETNVGFAGGNNLGLKYCSGDYLLLLNTDATLTSPQTLQTLTDFLDAHPHVALAQAKLQRSETLLDACGEFLTTWGVLYHHGYQQPDGPHTASPFPIYAAKAACCLLRKVALDKVGQCLFRDDYFCYGEDLELAHRLWLAGEEVWFVPTDPVFHAEGRTAATLPQKCVWQHYLNNLWTTACDYWSWQAWLHLGCGLLLLLLGGLLCKGVIPHRRKPHPHFAQNVPDSAWMPRVCVRVPPTYLIACLRRTFANTLYALPQQKTPSKQHPAATEHL